jgi:N-acetylneuraminic acid mutarotase
MRFLWLLSVLLAASACDPLHDGNLKKFVADSETDPDPPAEERKVGTDGVTDAGELEPLVTLPGSFEEVGRLPEQLAEASAISHGDSIFLLGGRTASNMVGWLHRFRVERRTLTADDGPFPDPRFDAAGVSTGAAMYLVGGQMAQSRISKNVFRYVPGSRPALNPMVLPRETYGHVAVYLSPHIYVFGGALDDAIVRLNPETGETTTVGRMPVLLEKACAFTDGAKIYLVGGVLAANQRTSDRIYQFDPAMPGDPNNLEKSMTQLPARLPEPTGGAACGYDGKHFYVAGGSTGDLTAGRVPLDQVVRFTPSTGQVKRLRDRLPRAMEARAAAFHEGALYIFGGSAAGGLATFHDNIYRYVPGLDVPASKAPTAPPEESGFHFLVGRLTNKALQMTAVQGTDGRAEVVMVGSNNQIWRTRENADKSFDDFARRPVGAPTNRALRVAALALPNAGLDVFMIGLDNRMWHAVSLPDGTFPDFNTGPVGSEAIRAIDLTVVRKPSGAVCAFMVGIDNRIRRIDSFNGQFPDSGFRPVAGSTHLAKRLVATLRADGSVDLFTIALDGRLWHSRERNDGTFPDFAAGPVGSVYNLATAIAVTTDADDRVSVFMVGLDGQAWRSNEQENGTYPDFAAIPLGQNEPAVTDIAYAARTDGTEGIYALRAGNQNIFRWGTTQ